MSEVDISIIIPSIRTHYWQRVYDSLVTSCKKYSYELVLVGPFCDEQFLYKVPDYSYQYISSYASPSVCIQQAVPQCRGKLICQMSDDGLLYEDGLDHCIDTYLSSCRKNDIVNCRYREGVNFQAQEFPLAYWSPKGYPPNIYGLPGINQNWWLCLQTLICRKFFMEIGGLDCRFEFVNHCYHDLSFRIQNMGGNVYQSSHELCVYDHMPGIAGDHQPISDAQEGPDTEKFNSLWNAPSNRYNINYDNWKQCDEVWARRFDKNYSSYEELCKEKGYINA